jgi:hypothetical protein
MIIIPYILAAIFVTYAVISLAGSVSLGIRKRTLESTGNKIVQDYGVLSKSRIFTRQQSLRLMKLEKDGQSFFIIEERTARFILWPESLSDINWLKLDAEGAKNLINLVSNSAEH